MSFTNKLKDRLKSLAEQAEQKLIEIQVDPEIREARLAECEACPHLLHLTHNCLKCGCFVKAKTMIKEASCPIGKW